MLNILTVWGYIYSVLNSIIFVGIICCFCMINEFKVKPSSSLKVNKNTLALIFTVINIVLFSYYGFIKTATFAGISYILVYVFIFIVIGNSKTYK